MLSIGGNERISQTTQYLDCWLSALLRSEVKNVLKVEEGTCPTAGDITEQLFFISIILHVTMV